MLLAHSAMKLFLWIFTLFHSLQTISGLLYGNQRQDLVKRTMSTTFAQIFFPNHSSLKTCQHSNDSYEENEFLLKTCRQCWRLITSLTSQESELDYRNQSQMESACQTMENDCVERVTMCCQNASDCCRKQLKEIPRSTSQSCPVTWDGIMCFDATDVNVTIQLTCPSFIPFFKPGEYFRKRCMSTGNITYWEPAIYTTCYLTKIENEILISEIKRYFLIVSLCFLFLSLVVFSTFKSLRSQQRIKVHINLFLTLFWRCVFELILNFATINLYMKMKRGENENDTFYRSSACSWITIFLKYFQNSTFSWMLCEALLLYQLLFRTFEQIYSIKLYLCIGWGVSFCFSSIYFFIRKFHVEYELQKNDCWVKELPEWEYLIRGPNILFLLLNIIFLINIIRLIRNLPNQPYDTSYSRRTFKAVIILVPLFGLQLLLVAISMPQESPFYLGYTIFQIIIQDSQGITVSLAFCAFNQEVLNILKQKFHLFKCNANNRIPHHTQNSRSYGRKHGSGNLRSILRSSNSIPVSARESVEQPFKIYEHTRENLK